MGMRMAEQKEERERERTRANSSTRERKRKDCVSVWWSFLIGASLGPIEKRQNAACKKYVVYTCVSICGKHWLDIGVNYTCMTSHMMSCSRVLGEEP
jgi:hypothetical protein